MTEELKKAIESAKTEEERKAVTLKFKDEIIKLSADEFDEAFDGWDLPYTSLKELEQVSGGCVAFTCFA